MLEHSAAHRHFYAHRGNRRAPGSSTAAHPASRDAASFAARIHVKLARAETGPTPELNASYISAGLEGIITAAPPFTPRRSSTTVHTVETRDEANRFISITRDDASGALEGDAGARQWGGSLPPFAIHESVVDLVDHRVGEPRAWTGGDPSTSSNPAEAFGLAHAHVLHEQTLRAIHACSKRSDRSAI